MKKKKEKKFSHTVEKCFKLETSRESFDDLTIFLEKLQELDKTASKGTHYHNLNDWTRPNYDFLHNQLEKYGFIEAAPLKGLTQPMDAKFWCTVYDVMGSVIYSVHLKSKAAYHHSSAWERNQALMADIQDIIKFKPKETITE